MSEQAARAALERMNMREVAVAPHYTGLPADLRQMAATEPEDGHAKFMTRRAEVCAAYGFNTASQSKPFAFADGFAIIPVSGSLINRFGQSWGYVTGYNFIRSQMNAALVDDDVKAIIFDLNSYGGEAAGCFELSDEIFAARGTKPMIGVVDSNCYSACYAIGSALDKLVVTPSGGVGSIGVVAMHVDMSKMLADWGITVTFIHAGEHKVDGNPYQALSEDVRADIQKGIDQSYDKFVALVARNRNIDAKVVRDTQARTYRADDALSLGLIDAIATPSQVVQLFFSELSSGSNLQLQKEDTQMSEATQKPDSAAAEQAAVQASAQAAAEARTAERTRVSGILNCEESKGREKLANHIALNTDMSVEVAKGLLAAAPAEAAATTAPAAAGNPFKATMDADQHPQVGADGGEGGAADAELSAAQLILRAQAAATGISVK